MSRGTTHLLYLHGFRSSPRSNKAQRMAHEVEVQRNAGRNITWWCPQLPPSPAQAVREILAGTAGWPHETTAVMGSSLGGFYAGVVAERLGCPAVVLNPAVDPARDLARHIGEQTTWQKPEEHFYFRAEYVDEYRVVWPDATVHWISARGSVHLGPDGEPREMSGVNCDVTAQTLTAARLRDAERLRAAAEQAPAMVWITDAEGRCTYLSRRWYEVTGHGHADALGSGWLEALHPDDRPRVAAEFESAMRARGAFRTEYRLRRRDGSYVAVLDLATPHTGPTGAFLGFVGSAVERDPVAAPVH